MNTIVSSRLYFGLFLFLSGVLISCTKEKQQVNRYVLGDVAAPGYFPGKNNIKSDLQFISIAFTDLYGVQIPNAKLSALTEGYNSLGDKQIIIDRILRNLLKDPSIQKPDMQSMRGDIPLFVRDCYRRFLVREPNESELWYLKKLIEENETLTPEDIFYAFMTSEEYKYY
jgi:hypothetical protein